MAKNDEESPTGVTGGGRMGNGEPITEERLAEMLKDMELIFGIRRNVQNGMFAVTMDTRYAGKPLADAFLSALQAFEPKMQEMVLTAMMAACAEVMKQQPYELTKQRLESYTTYIMARPEAAAQC